VVLAQLLRHDHLDFELLSVVLVVAALALAACLLELHLLGLLFVLLPTSRLGVGAAPAALRVLPLFPDRVYAVQVALDRCPLLSLDAFTLLFLVLFIVLVLLLGFDQALLLAALRLLLGRSLIDHGEIGLDIPGFYLELLHFVLPNGQRIFKLLSEVLIDGLTALQDGSSILKALNLFKDKTCSINFVLLTAVDGDDALPVLLLLIRQDLYLSTPRTLNYVPNHVPL
jgi:hypothetical protein